jgi:protein SEY1
LCLVMFEKEMLDGLCGEEYSFMDIVVKARMRCKGTFTDGAKEAMVEEDAAKWNWEQQLWSLEEEIGVVEDQRRNDEMRKVLNQIEVCCVSV